MYMWSLLDINHCIWCARHLVDDDHWIDAQLLLQCDWVHSYYRVGVEVRLYNLHLLQRIAVKEPGKTQWADIYRVAEKAGHELLGVGGHLGITAWNTWNA